MTDFAVDEYGYIEMGCIRHKQMFSVYVGDVLFAECDGCFAEASFGCKLPILYCDEQRRDYGPNESCPEYHVEERSQ